MERKEKSTGGRWEGKMEKMEWKVIQERIYFGK